MRQSLRPHAPTLAAFAACLVVAGGMGLAIPAPGALRPASPFDRPPIPLPLPSEDQDLDSYADAVDRTDGDLWAQVDFLELQASGSEPEPYIMLGTQDDHDRHGEGGELEWLHVVDHDPLGHRAGSRAWQRDALRTGTWVQSVPHDDLPRGIAVTQRLREDGAPKGAAWPLQLQVNVRDDRANVTLAIEMWDGGPSPHRLLGRWDLRVRTAEGVVEWGGQEAPLGARVGLGLLGNASEAQPDGEPSPAKGGLRLRVTTTLGIDAATKARIAAAWAPIILFAKGEAFFPVPGDALARFHGFAPRDPDFRTWDMSFNDGRDDYRLLLADYDGNRVVDHRDAKVMTDVLREGPVAAPTVQAHVTVAAQGEVVVQFWFLYFYNFVPDDAGRDLEVLGHTGDREFMQLRFRDLGEALTGRPTSVSYSQHHEGIRIEGGEAGDAPFHLDDHHPAVFVALGSHASYPVAGDDRARRPAFVGYYDTFDGEGERWEPGDYAIEVLGNQHWHMGHLWGASTRYVRDLGTSFRPLLQFDFRYPYSDPTAWEVRLETLTSDEAADLYGDTP